MATVTARVLLIDETGSVVALAPGDTVPDWATVTNPDVLDHSDEDKPAPAKKAPAKKATADS